MAILPPIICTRPWYRDLLPRAKKRYQTFAASLTPLPRRADAPRVAHRARASAGEPAREPAIDHIAPPPSGIGSLRFDARSCRFRSGLGEMQRAAARTARATPR